MNEEWEKLTNCEKLRYRICNLDVSENTSNKLFFEIANIEDEIFELQDRINKAIEYIENPRHEMSVKTYQELKGILIGDNNE